MEKIEVHSTSLNSATCSDIVLRKGDLVRLVFRPEIVDNAANPNARVKGIFIYQKKGKADSWEKSDAAPLSSLKKAEGFQLALDSSETLTLRRGLHELARLQHEQDIPQGHAEFVKAESHFAPLLDLSPADLNRFFRPWRNHG
jgi:hypothetical protein